MSTKQLVIDDHILLRMLLHDEPADLRPRGATLFTTGLWYHRLCRALADHTVAGAMSRSLGHVDPDVASAVLRSVIELPESIGLLSLRSLGSPMGQLISAGVRLNLLSLEALAAAGHLRAEICLAGANHNPPLREAAAGHGVPVRLITR